MKNAKIILWIGFFLPIVGIFFADNIQSNTSIYTAAIFVIGLLIVGEILFTYGCILYLKEKGYKWYVGLLAGILNMWGLLLVFLLPNKKSKRK